MVIDGVADGLPSGVKHKGECVDFADACPCDEGRNIKPVGIDRVGRGIYYVFTQFAPLEQQRLVVEPALALGWFFLFSAILD